jgi:hypothetical protein
MIAKIIKDAGTGTIVLLDYLQKMPASDSETISDGYRVIKKINEVLIESAIKGNVILICGAQMNRTAGEYSDGTDKLSDGSFRESGDIEQDAHNAFGIGRIKYEGKRDLEEKVAKTGENKSCTEYEQKRYLKVLKTRESGEVGNKYNMEVNGKYVYMRKDKEYFYEENQNNQSNGGDCKSVDENTSTIPDKDGKSGNKGKGVAGSNPREI